MEKQDSVQRFLELIRRSHRGKFKVYIGMSAGVGKTYRMLQEARQLLNAGVDVSIGYIETHGRPDTEALVSGLPVIARRKLFYKGKELEEMDFTDVRGSGLTKKELLLLEREKDKLAKQLGGIRNMNRTPSAMFVVDVNKEALAVEEAHKLGIPVVAIVDTNADPESVEYPIAANDDAIRGIELLSSLMADAVAEGLLERSGKAAKAEGETEQPMAAWEKELLTEGAPAADAPAEAEAEGEAKAE